MPATWEAKYLDAIGWIRQTLHGRARNQMPVSSLNFQRLRQYFNSELLTYAKVVYGPLPVPPLTRLGLSQLADFENMPRDGIALLDTFFIVQEKQDVESLHFHELIHIVQWKLLGPKAFLARYADELERFGYDNSPLEVMARDAEAKFKESTQPFDAEEFVQLRLK